MNRTRRALVLLLVCTLVLSVGCATIFKGSTEKVDFSSDPEGAKVYVNGQMMGRAPMQLSLDSRKSYTIEFRKEGFESRSVIVNSSVGAGWVILDLLFTVWPLIVDAATGDWNGLDTNNVSASLESTKKSSALAPAMNIVAACPK